MAVQKQDDQHEHTFSNYVRIQDVVQKTCLRQWTIGKSCERGSGIFVLPARHDDDDDDIYCILTFFFICNALLLTFHFSLSDDFLERLRWFETLNKSYSVERMNIETDKIIANLSIYKKKKKGISLRCKICPLTFVSCHNNWF